jgi:hypothetical protein
MPLISHTPSLWLTGIGGASTQHHRSGSIDVSTYHRQATVLYRVGGGDAILQWEWIDIGECG